MKSLTQFTRKIIRTTGTQLLQYEKLLVGLHQSPGRRCILKGWEKAGVKEIANSDKPPPPVDPFEEIDLS